MSEAIPNGGAFPPIRGSTFFVGNVTGNSKLAASGAFSPEVNFARNPCCFLVAVLASPPEAKLTGEGICGCRRTLHGLCSVYKVMPTWNPKEKRRTREAENYHGKKKQMPGREYTRVGLNHTRHSCHVTFCALWWNFLAISLSRDGGTFRAVMPICG